MPFESYRPDPNRLVWAPEAEQLWARLRLDKPLTKAQSESVTTAADKPPSSPSSSPSGASPSGSPTPSDQQSVQEAEQARENGLCA